MPLHKNQVIIHTVCENQKQAFSSWHIITGIVKSTNKHKHLTVNNKSDEKNNLRIKYSTVNRKHFLFKCVNYTNLRTYVNL